ncbi:MULTISPECIES: peptidoglycan recognition protein family protein [unclassified Streptomyces]|uniref:peptidoglycan recognition protein family protein n=1 Tax=unclassified Streptomyces TaxID=2593676 RepID=UPI0022B6909B|nr:MULTISPECIES: peptidoglycan recognition family protein [unclassified Streptomyces]MCZ7415283.1 peptidoglycan recognition family protein [Streptomyces sp. WMMC897]MCZ7432224.1 peptidoglycan recognition family protein [Streptomyces sp. WMMC1477]
MATPLTAGSFLAALRAEGVRVVEVGDWRTHNRDHVGAWGPVHGVMIHHTVTSGTQRTVDICRRGYSGLPGPLCHGVVAKDGTVHLVGYGRANHAGKGDDDVLAAVIAERSLPPDNEANVDGNARFYGFECENLGDGKDPWPAAQVEAIVRASAAVCRAHRWGRAGDTSVIGHHEWQPGKIDPRGPGVSMPDIRRRVVERLRHPADWSPDDDKEEDMALSDADIEKIAERVWRRDGLPVSWGTEENPAWAAYSILHHATEVGRENRGRIKHMQATLAGLSAAVSELSHALAEHHEEIDPDALVARIQAAIEATTIRLEVDEGA